MHRIISSTTQLISARLQRGFSVAALGPNEARMLYDCAVSIIGLVVVGAFMAWFAPTTMPVTSKTALLLLAPVFLVITNTALGIYTRLKLSSGRVKALVLLASVALVVALLTVLSGSIQEPLLWGLIIYGPLAAVRLVLALPYSRHPTLRSISVNRRGPVLVIGGAGYIGSHTVDLLLASGQNVRVLDRLMYGRTSLASFENHPRFEFLEGDVTDIRKLTSAMKDTSGVVHLAGLVGDPACAVDANFTRHANIVATRMAKDIAQSLGVHRFIFASSCSVYGVTDREVSEHDPLNPVSLYAQTKIDSEKELLFSVRDDFFVTILRFATVFGHSRRPRFDLVGNLFTAQAMQDGLITVLGPHQWRPFIHVRDLARAIVQVFQAPPAIVQSQIFNVGDRRLNMTIQQLAETVKTVAEKYGPVSISVQESAGDRRNYAVSFQKIRKTLGFEANITIHDGLAEIAENFHRGVYDNYRQEIYSNVAITRRAAGAFHDSTEIANLYGPLSLSVE